MKAISSTTQVPHRGSNGASASAAPVAFRMRSPRTQRVLVGLSKVLRRSEHSVQVQVGSRKMQVCRVTDYEASAADEGVLALPSRTELQPDWITYVFGYPRDLSEHYYVGKIIGAGSFGVVRECLDKATHRRYAMKSIPKTPKRGPPTPRYLLKLRTEVETMQQLGYSLNAVNLKNVFEDNESIHLIMELCEGGALLERIESNVYSEKYIAQIARSVLRFISQCHAKGIIYRDVKPDNFLFLTKEEDSPLKATDFGLSIRHWSDEPKLTSRSGTPAYMAPELVKQCYDEKCDIWSVGMLIYQLLTGRFPFWEDVRNESLSAVWDSILNKEIDWNAFELRRLSPAAVNFLQTLLKKDPKLRPSAFDALSHPWVVEQGEAEDLPLEGSVVQRLQRFATYGHLKQMVLKMVVEEMQQENSLTAAGNGLQELFQQLDTDHSGTISFDELMTGLKKQGYIITEPELEQLVRKIDADNDGNIVLNEFLTTFIDWNNLQKDAKWQMYLDHAFAKMDENGDGFISLEELLGQLPQVPYTGQQGKPERLAEAKKMLREADTNGDGRISKEEFNDLLKNNHAPDSLSFYDDRLALHVRDRRGASPSTLPPTPAAKL